MKYRLRSLLLLLMVLAVGYLLVPWAPRARAAIINGGTIAEGVYIGDIDLSGKTLDEAKKLLDDYFKKTQKSVLKLYVYDNYVNKDTPSRTDGQTLLNSFHVPFSDLGFSWSVEESLAQAVSFGQGGRLVERYKNLQDMKYENVRLPIDYKINAETVQNYITERICPEVNHGPSDAKISVSYPNVYVSEKEKVGIEVNVGATTEKIMMLFSEGIPSDPSLNVSVKYIEPEHTAADFSKMTGVIGQFTTQVELSEEKKNRNYNIKVLLENYINGTVVMPGEVFSIWKTLGGDTTSEKGFVPAGAFREGTLQDEDGGGVCQASTTLYNAALFAELEIVERFPHSMVISYVHLAQDCALAYDYKDLKFRNTTDAPIYLETFCEGDQVIARIYGQETRPSNRSLVFETTYVKRIVHGPKYSLRYDRNPGAPTISGDIHMEAEAYCTKKVLVNGVVVSEEKIADDHYVPEQQIVTIGCNTLNLHVKRTGDYEEKVYDQNENQLLVNAQGLPFYDGVGGYLLVKDYESDADGHALYNSAGGLIPRWSPVPTPTTPAPTEPTTEATEPATTEPTTEPSTEATEPATTTAPETTPAETTPAPTEPTTEATEPATTTAAPETTTAAPTEPPTTAAPTTATEATTAPAPTTVTLGEDYLHRTDVEAVKAAIEKLGISVNIQKTASKDPSFNPGEICWIEQGGTDIGPSTPIQTGSAINIHVHTP